MSVLGEKRNVEEEFAEVDSKRLWAALYQHVRNECLNHEYTVQEARKAENKNLNRYRDVNPYDHSRVVLSRGQCDYINANLVVMEKAHRRYILTQGPLPNTTGHFWLMVWEQNCKAVLMLNRIIEKKQVKCHQYWPLGPDCGNDEIVLSDVGLKVQCVSEKEISYYTTRVLRLIEMETGSCRDILHFHYTTWPDFGVPQSPTAFLNFLMVVRQSGVLSENVGPPVVHCSAGIGRSGTFCLVDSCLVLIEEYGIDAVNVRDVLLEMRKFRMGLIQTPDQLRFSYLAIIEGTKKDMNINLEGDGNMDLIELTAPNSDTCNSHSPEESDEPPPLPPPRGESLKKSFVSDGINSTDNSVDNKENSICGPPDKPLPVEPENGSSLYLVDNVSYGNSINTEDITQLLDKSPSEEDLATCSVLRQRKQDLRKEKKERLAAQVREIKRKQEASENWQQMKNTIFSPFNIGVGVGILLIGGGIFAYVYYSNKI